MNDAIDTPTDEEREALVQEARQVAKASYSDSILCQDAQLGFIDGVLWLQDRIEEPKPQGEPSDAPGVVAEEPEWEYGYELLESDTRDVLDRGWPFDTAEEAKERADLRAKEEFDPEYPPLIPQVVRRHEAGPWVPVKQEAADR